MYECFACMYVYATCLRAAPIEDRGGAKFPATGMTGDYERQWGCQKKNLGPLQDHPFLLLMTEPSLQFWCPSFFFLPGINSEGYQERESFEFEFNVHVLSLGNSSLRDILTIFFIANKMTSK